MYFNHSLGRIYYKVLGDGFPILTFHGFGLDHRCMYNTLEPLCGKRTTFKRIYFDLPGMGLSRAEIGLKNADKMMEIINAFIEEILPAENYAVFALSYGAYLARYLLKQKNSRIKNSLLLCPVIEPLNKDRVLPLRRVVKKDPLFIKSLTKAQYNEIKDFLVVQTQAVWDNYQKDILPALGLVDEDFLRRYSENGYGFSSNIDNLTKSLKCDVTFVLGKDDHVVGYKEALNLLPNYENANVHLISGAGHYLNREKESIFNKIMSDWLTNIIQLDI